jgi:hypothetical protein
MDIKVPFTYTTDFLQMLYLIERDVLMVWICPLYEDGPLLNFSRFRKCCFACLFVCFFAFLGVIGHPSGLFSAKHELLLVTIQ